MGESSGRGPNEVEVSQFLERPMMVEISAVREAASKDKLGSREMIGC